ncbi:MAG: hypothetical protein IKO11_05340 [Lachnospiraceae bacterium]|nr:hypothetical protein [Lachnospiraceae bacterium]
MAEDKLFLAPKLSELKKIREEQITEADPALFLAVHEADLELAVKLKRSMKLLADSFIPERHNRQALEDLCMLRLITLYHLARRFHPCTTYGMELLKASRALRAVFEEKAGPLVSRIDASNAELFRCVLPVDLWEAVKLGRFQAIGILQSISKRICGVGALVYEEEQLPPDNETVCRIHWLYVNPEWGRRGCADVLLAELITAEAESGVRAFTADIPIEDSFEVFGQLFSDWHFRFMAGVSTRFAVRPAEQKDDSRLKQYAKTSAALSELPGDLADRLIRDALSEGRDRAYVTKLADPVDFIDKEMSFYLGEAEAPQALLLVHRRPSGKLSVEYAHSNVRIDDIRILLGCLAMAAVKKYGKKAELAMEPQTEELADLLEELFPQQRAYYQVEAILDEPVADVSEEEVAQALEEAMRQALSAKAAKEPGSRALNIRFPVPKAFAQKAKGEKTDPSQIRISVIRIADLFAEDLSAAKPGIDTVAPGEKIQVLPDNPPAEPHTISFDRKFARLKEADEERLKAASKAMEGYFDAADKEKYPAVERHELRRAGLADERFALAFLRGEKGGQETADTPVGLLQLLIENPIRLNEVPLTVPFWAINEGIREIEKISGHKQRRHLRFPGLHVHYVARVLRYFNGMSDYSNTRGRFFDRFFSDYRPDKHILVTEKKRTAGLYAEGEEEEAAEAKESKENKE